MEQFNFLDDKTFTKYDSFKREDLIKRVDLLEKEVARVVKENYELRKIDMPEAPLQLFLDEQLREMQNTIYGSSSERLADKFENEKPKEIKVSEKKNKKTF